MKISQLSEHTGVALPTLKMYLREGLLQPGEKSGPNQASYGEDHAQRVRLVHGLLRVGGLSVAAAREVVEAIASDAPLVHVFAVAQHAASAHIDPTRIAERALDAVDGVIAGWCVESDGPGRLVAAEAIDAFQAAGMRDDIGWAERYAAAALLVAEADLDMVDARVSRDAKAETVVLGTALGDAFFAGLRRAAQEHVSKTRYPRPDDAEEPRPVTPRRANERGGIRESPLDGSTK